MKKLKNIKTIIIVLLSITVIFMGIGFMFLSMKLDQETKKERKYDVVITNVKTLTSIQGGETPPTSTRKIINEEKTIKFDFVLNSPKDELAYNITLKNIGNLPAKIIKLISTTDYINNTIQKLDIEPVTITVTELENKILEPEEKIDIKVIVKRNVSNIETELHIPYELTVLATNTN